MKNTKRIVLISIVAIAVIAICIGTVLALGNSAGNKNEKNLETMMDAFSKTISENCADRIVETKSVYGKLNGNGNGIQYFGVVLVRNGSIDDIDSLISALDERFEVVEYWAQEDSNITSKYLEHKTLKYDTSISPDDELISICFYNSSHPDSDLLDIEGH